MRVFKEFKKEIDRSMDDRRFVVLLVIAMILIPLVVMSIMGSTFQEVANDLRVIVIDTNPSEYSEAIIKSINDSTYFDIVPFEGNIGEAKDRIGRDIVAVFYISEGFETSLTNAEKGEISLYLDSSDFIIFNFVESKSNDIFENSIQEIIQLIVVDLETEKLDTVATNLAVKDLVDSLYDEINIIDENLEDVNLDSLIDEMDSLKAKIDECGNCSVTSINTQIASIKADLVDYSDAVSDAESSSSDSRAVSSDIKAKIDNLKLDLKTLKNEFLSEPLKIDKEYVFGDTNYFEYLLPAIISASLFFVVFTLTIVNRIRGGEKKRKKKGLVGLNVLMIKSLFYILIGTIELIYILLLAKFVFNASVPLSSFPTFIVLILLAISSVGLGLVFSFIFRTERQAILLGPLVILPLILISETFSSLEILPRIFGFLAFISPLYYANLALREIMLKGSDLYDLIFPLGALFTYAIFSVALGLVIFFIKKR